MPRLFRPAGLVLLALALLAACATTENYEKKLNFWLGKSEKELVSSWGIPDKQYQVDPQTKMLSYAAHNAVVYPGAPATCTSTVKGNTVVSNCFGGLPPELEMQNCETVFTITEGVVRRWGHRGNNCRSE
jgi:hypothetical protein